MWLPGFSVNPAERSHSTQPLYHKEANTDVDAMVSMAVENEHVPGSCDKFVQTSSTGANADHIIHKPKRRRKRPQHLINSACNELTHDSNSVVEPRVNTRNPKIAQREPSSLLESLPAELLQIIASYAYSDNDLCNLMQASPNVAIALNANESGVWRNRFLAKYDYPFISDSREEFGIAYKLRQFVLRNFIGFGGPEDDRTAVQLTVIRDIVLETYNRPNEYGPLPLQSRNLELLSKCSLAITFLSSPFSAYDTARYGKANVLFDTLQLQLSHLVLSPSLNLGQRFPTPREHYDLSLVYNFNQPFSLLCTKLPITTCSRSPSAPRDSSGKRLMDFPEYVFDAHILLHIRNFWQRHLVHDSQLSTYAPMANDLLRLGMSPQIWDKPLQHPVSLSNRWVGNYSCLHPWPKNYVDLEERQSSAEDWGRVDPLVLDWVTCRDNTRHCFWPPAFNSIPAFRDTMPSKTERDRNELVFIRGSSNFMSLATALNNHLKPNPQDDEVQEYHPFKAYRLRGFIHDISDPVNQNIDQQRPKRTPKRPRSSCRLEERPSKETTIPGWKRIVMIMYKPTIRYLIQVLEHAEEDYGGLFGTEVTTNFNTAAIWNNDSTDLDADSSLEDILEGVSHEGTETISNQQPTGGANMPITEEQLENQLKAILNRRIASFTRNYSTFNHSSARPSLFSPSHIISLEDSFIPSSYMAWDDGMSIERAYAYEGVLLPGGKIALGRFYRCHGIDGLGDGREVGTDGIGVEVRPVSKDDNQNCSSSKRSENERQGDQFEIFTNVDGTGEVVAARTAGGNGACKGLDRGPFVFWAY